MIVGVAALLLLTAVTVGVATTVGLPEDLSPGTAASSDEGAMISNADGAMTATSSADDSLENDGVYILKTTAHAAGHTSAGMSLGAFSQHYRNDGVFSNWAYVDSEDHFVMDWKFVKGPETWRLLSTARHGATAGWGLAAWNAHGAKRNRWSSWVSSHSGTKWPMDWEIVAGEKPCTWRLLTTYHGDGNQPAGWGLSAWNSAGATEARVAVHAGTYWTMDWEIVQSPRGTWDDAHAGKKVCPQVVFTADEKQGAESDWATNVDGIMGGLGLTHEGGDNWASNTDSMSWFCIGAGVSAEAGTDGFSGAIDHCHSLSDSNDDAQAYTSICHDQIVSSGGPSLGLGVSGAITFVSHKSFIAGKSVTFALSVSVGEGYSVEGTIGIVFDLTKNGPSCLPGCSYCEDALKEGATLSDVNNFIINLPTCLAENTRIIGITLGVGAGVGTRRKLAQKGGIPKFVQALRHPTTRVHSGRRLYDLTFSVSHCETKELDAQAVAQAVHETVQEFTCEHGTQCSNSDSDFCVGYEGMYSIPCCCGPVPTSSPTISPTIKMVQFPGGGSIPACCLNPSEMNCLYQISTGKVDCPTPSPTTGYPTPHPTVSQQLVDTLTMLVPAAAPASAPAPKKSISIGGVSIPGFSDRRLKHSIKPLDKSPSGIPIYQWQYNRTMDSNLPAGTFRGVMAQDLLQMEKQYSVLRTAGGFYAVNYELIDVTFEKIE